jgi:hypothetical protein
MEGVVIEAVGRSVEPSKSTRRTLPVCSTDAVSLETGAPEI